MICRVSDFEEMVLVGENPKSVFVTTAIHVERLQRKADGHYTAKIWTNWSRKGMRPATTRRPYVQSRELLTTSSLAVRNGSERRDGHGG